MCTHMHCLLINLGLLLCVYEQMYVEDLFLCKHGAQRLTLM